jgi:hypothetical protein
MRMGGASKKSIRKAPAPVTISLAKPLLMKEHHEPGSTSATVEITVKSIATPISTSSPSIRNHLSTPASAKIENKRPSIISRLATGRRSSSGMLVPRCIDSQLGEYFLRMDFINSFFSLLQ